MRRLILGPLAVCLLAACLASPTSGRADDAPAYAGTWKVTALLDVNEVSFWLLEFGKDGKSVKMVSGLYLVHDKQVLFDVRKTKASDLKATDKVVRCQLTQPGTFTFSLTAYPGKKKGVMYGSLRSGMTDFLRVRLDRTDETEIDPDKAGKPQAGANDFIGAARDPKLPDPEDRIKALQLVLKKHAGEPITYLASQQLLTYLMMQNKPVKEMEAPAETYVKQAEVYGHELTVAANLEVGLLLGTYEKAQALGLTYVKKAAELVAADDPSGLALSAYLGYVQALEANKKPDDAGPYVAKIERAAEEVIKEVKDDKARPEMTYDVARMLLYSPNAGVQELALKHARDLEKALKEDDAEGKRLAVLQLLGDALAKRGKADEAKKVEARVEAIEVTLDRKFEKQNVDFDVEKFDARKGKGRRVVLVELFTGAQCLPCVAADVAYDAALKTYGPRDVVFLQYHLHIPPSDALTTPEGEARFEYYFKDDERVGTPAMLVDGKATTPMGSSKKATAKVRYESLRDLVEEAVEVKEGAKLELKVTRKGEQVAVKAEASGLAKTGKQVRLRFALVEEVVRYPGANGQRLHQRVVRAMPGKAAGLPVEQESGSYEASVDLAELRKGHDKYLADYAAKRGQFRTPPRRMELKKLKVVAFVQDDETKAVLQAAQADVPDAKE